MDIKVDNPFGTLFVTNGDNAKFQSYYSTLDALRPLLRSSEWLSETTGWYLNVGDDNFSSVRISYFCPNDEDPRQLVKEYLACHSLLYFAEPNPPKKTKVAAKYGGEELRFRRYLANYTHIGLDIMSADLHHAQCLFATFRWQVFMAKEDYKQHFAPTFEEHSPFYCAMSQGNRQQFWSDLECWPNPPEVDWAHMFVNMILKPGRP